MALNIGRSNAAEVTEIPTFVASMMGTQFLNNPTAAAATIASPSPAKGLGL